MKLGSGHKCVFFFVEITFLINIFLSMGRKMLFISTDSAIYTFLSMELACGHTCSVFLVEMAFLIKIFLSMGPKSDQTLKNVNADRSSFFCQKNVFLSMECGP